MAGDDGDIDRAADGLDVAIGAHPFEGHRRFNQELRHLDRIENGHAGRHQHRAVDLAIGEIPGVAIEEREFGGLLFAGLHCAGAQHVAEEAVNAAALPLPAQAIVILRPDQFRFDPQIAVETQRPGLRQITTGGIAAQDQ